MNPWPKRIVWIALLAGALVAFFWAMPTPEPVIEGGAGTLAIRGVRVFDGETVLESANVVIHRGLIAAVGPDVEIPASVEVIDGTGKTLLPGFIDSHTHSQGLALADAVRFGVTTEIDMFMEQNTAADIRRRQQQGSKLGEANLVSAGTLVTTPGGHGTQFGLAIPTLAAAADADAFVADRIAEGSDFIKIIHEDGALWQADWNAFDPETLAAIVRAAHRRDKLAVVHVSTLERTREAIQAGADGLVHVFGDQIPDEEFLNLILESGAFVTPTLCVMASAGGRSDAPDLSMDPRLTDMLSPAQMQSLNQPFPESTVQYELAEEAVRALHQAGVPILAGTDAGNPGTTHGASVHQELVHLVHAGLSPTEALEAATSVTADTFGLTDRGRVAPGQRADLLLVTGDPTRNITDTRNIQTIWKDGRQINRALSASSQPDAGPAPEVPAGMISDFETGDRASQFGFGWQISLDDRMGGFSAAESKVLEEDGNYFLQIIGEIRAGAPFPWAGEMFFPGEQPTQPVDASAADSIAFKARGEGSPARLIVFTGSFSSIPSIVSFEITADWQEFGFPLSSFSGPNDSTLTGILFAGPMTPGPFRLEVDDVELR